MRLMGRGYKSQLASLRNSPRPDPNSNAREKLYLLNTTMKHRLRRMP